MSTYYNGNKNLLNNQTICLFCSRALPLSIYYTAFDFMKKLVNTNITLASGWQSAIEKKALKLRTNESQIKIIYYLAKGMKYFSIPKYLEKAFEENKLLIISQWNDGKRIENKKVDLRNQQMVEKFNKFLFLSIHENGKLHELFNKCLKKGKKVYILGHHSNAVWVDKGAIPILEQNIQDLL